MSVAGLSPPPSCSFFQFSCFPPPPPPPPAGGKISGIRKAKQIHMERLAVEISAGVVIPVERYYFSLPTGRAHTSHEVLEFPRPGGWGQHTHVQTDINVVQYTLTHVPCLVFSAGRHFTPLRSVLVEEIQKVLQTGVCAHETTVV